MKILSVDIENFLIISEAHLELANQGLVLVNGENHDAPQFDSNGSGKTAALIDSVTWALWGSTSKSIGADDVVHKHGSNCRVAVHLQDGNDDYHIVRFRKHKTFRNSLVLEVNQSDVSGSSVKDTQDRIDKLIGVDYKTFMNSVVFTNSAVKRFTEMTDRERKEALESILAIEWLTEAYSAVGRDLTNEQATLDALIAELADIQDDIDREENKLLDLEAKSAEFDAQKAGRIRFLERQRDAHKKEVRGLIDELNEVSDAIQSDDDLHTVYDDELLTSKKLVEKRNEDLAKLMDKIAEVKAQIGSSRRDEKKASTAIDKFQKLQQTPVCWTCGQPVDDEHSEEALDEYHVAKQKAVLEREAAEKTLSEYQAKKRSLEKKTYSEEMEQDKRVEAAKEAIHENTRLKREKQNIRKALKFQKLKVKEYTKEIRVAEGEENAFDDLVVESKERLKELRASHKSKHKKAVRSKKKIGIFEFWRVGFSTSGIRSLVLDGVANFLNQSVIKYTEVLTGGAIDIEFSTLTKLKNGEVRDKFDIRTVNRSGAQSYAANSAGEQRRIDLCTAFAFGDLVASRADKRFDILLLDEVFDHLDDSGVQYVMVLLHQLVQHRGSVFVISHNDTLKAQFSNVMTVVRKGGSATVV